MPLSPRVPDVPSLQLLLAVASSGSINGAAAAMGISQQAASQRLRALETRVGLSLIARGSHGSTLTESGVLLAQWSSTLVQVAQQLDVAIMSLRTDRAVELHVAASLTLAEHLVPRWLVALSESQQRLGLLATRVRLTAQNSAAVCRSVLCGEADIGFIESPGLPAGLRSTVVALDQLLLVVRPDHPWTLAAHALTVRQLASTALVWRESGSGTRDAFVTALNEWAAAHGEGIEIATPGVELSSSAAVRAAVLAGAGPAVLSELAVADDVAAGRLVSVEIAGLGLRRSLRAVWVGTATPPSGPGRDLIQMATKLAR
ncbi:LysR family transcriptional regulator [Nakamurella antarctica]|uniref:LysR family transcriptional regulator n=1 Tax=Nakamurella antarctica TaxID=1902245 RepID=A0A3G8ZJ77_9ACTN|nr:LysR family transcriptional regulator [Nakamurella antarctica]AZI57323.1 LysR family transcriptional regulator [Nakamurella antarctica]